MTSSQSIFSSNYKQSCIEEYYRVFSSCHTSAQQENAVKDIESIFENFLSSPFLKNMEATVVIGPIGSGKTMFSTYELEKRACWGSQHVYLSADYLCQYALKNTYMKEQQMQPREALRFWRPLGNLIVKFLQQEALKNTCSIVAEADPTDPSLPLLLDALKEHSYAIKVILLTTPDDIRRKSLKEPISYEEDAKFYEQAEVFSRSITTTYLEAADEVEFYLRNRLDTKPSHAATWIKTDFTQEAVGKLHVFDENLLEGIVRVHDLTLKCLAESQGFPSFTCLKDLLARHSI